MPVTTAPAVEAMAEIVSRINSATAYTLPSAATRSDAMTDQHESISDTQVTVIQEEEEQLEDTLASEDRSSHQIRVVIRKKIDKSDQSAIDAMRLLTRQIWQRLNDHNSSDRRVQVWEADIDPKEVPVKSVLLQHGVFLSSVLLRVEVLPS